jgi:hypothetical protein
MAGRKEVFDDFDSITSAPLIKAPSTTTNTTRAIGITTITTMAAEAGPMFTLFPRLAPELRLKIWKFAIIPRFVGFRSRKIPGVFHANTESRRESKYVFRIRDLSVGMLYNPEADIFLVDETSFSAIHNYHRHAFHTMQAMVAPSPGLSITQHIQKVAMTPKELNLMVVRECGHVHCCLEFYLPRFFPEITEFILILRPGPIGATAEDLYEVQSGNGHQYHQELIDEMADAFDMMQAIGLFEDVKLSFMRMEKWEDTRRNEPSGGRVLEAQE